MSDIVDILRRRLLQNRIKIETVLQLCAEADTNKDDVIHIDDLKGIFLYLLGDNCPSRRDIQSLESLLKVNSRGDIDFTRLASLLESEPDRRRTELRWTEDPPSRSPSIRSESNSIESSRRPSIPRPDRTDLRSDRSLDGRDPSRMFSPRPLWEEEGSTERSTRSTSSAAKAEAGSLGEWLERNSCPLEIQNYKKLIAALEEFEHSSGMKISTTRDGLTVPLGPDLRASVNFFLK